MINNISLMYDMRRVAFGNAPGKTTTLLASGLKADCQEIRFDSARCAISFLIKREVPKQDPPFSEASHPMEVREND